MANDLFRFRYRTDQNEIDVVEFTSRQKYLGDIWNRALSYALHKAKGSSKIVSLEVIDWGV